jgi:hypothetical protein
MWGLDVIGPIDSKANNGHKFILVAIEYFTKWVDAWSYAYITQKLIESFIEKYMICHYDVQAILVALRISMGSWLLSSALSGRLSILILLPTDLRWMVLFRQPIKISKWSSRKWWSPTKIEMTCFHTYLMHTTP